MRDVRLTASAHRQAGFALTNTQVVLASVAGTVLLAVALIAIGGPGSRRANAQSEQDVAMRLQPVGTVVVKAAAAGGGEPRTGEQLYQAACNACHGAGTLGAPKFGDAAAWGSRIKTGYDALMASATKGKNSMPARGGSDASDFELARAVVYMANKGGASFPEPKAPAAAASAAQ